MASVANKPAYRQMTVEEFLALEIEGRAELEDGILYMMAGGSFRHAAVGTNILAAVRGRLRGSGCRVVGPDFAVRTGPSTLRLPDASVYCGFPLLPEQERAKLLGDPKVIFEVLSPSTSALDQNVKLAEYRGLAGVDAVIFLDPDAERVRLVERTAPEAWTDAWLPKGGDLPLRAFGINLPHSELFALD